MYTLTKYLNLLYVLHEKAFIWNKTINCWITSCETRVTDRTGWQPLELNFLFFLIWFLPNHDETAICFDVCIVPTRKKTFRPMPFLVFHFHKVICGFTTQPCTQVFLFFFILVSVPGKRITKWIKRSSLITTQP